MISPQLLPKQTSRPLVALRVLAGFALLIIGGMLALPGTGSEVSVRGVGDAVGVEVLAAHSNAVIDMQVSSRRSAMRGYRQVIGCMNYRQAMPCMSSP